jgi:hypothetical protein
MFDDIRISLKKVLEEEILKIYKKYKWQPVFKVIEDLPGNRILIRFRIGLTDFMFADYNLGHLDPNYLSFWVVRFEEEFLKCEESAKARLAYDGKALLDERISDFYRRDREDRITRFEKIIADEKKHKRFLRKKFVEKIREIL